MAASTSPTISKPVFRWDQRDVEKFLKDNKENFFFNDESIDLIVDQEHSGSSLLELTRDELVGCGMKLGPASNIMRLIGNLDVSKPRKWNLNSFSYAYLLTVLSLL